MITSDFFDVAMQKLSTEFSHCLCVHKDVEIIPNQEHTTILQGKKARVVLIQDISQNYHHAAVIVQYVGHEFVVYPQLVVNLIQEIPQRIFVQTSNAFISRNINDNLGLVFTNSVYLYTTTFDVHQEAAVEQFKKFGMKLILRDDKYWAEFMATKIPDVFICHDSRDKEVFVDPLVNTLSKKLIKVWYDKLSLHIGDSLIEKIDEGLSQCKFGIVVISKNFLTRKQWTAREFKSLTTREIHTGRKVFFPFGLT